MHIDAYQATYKKKLYTWCVVAKVVFFLKKSVIDKVIILTFEMMRVVWPPLPIQETLPRYA